MRTILAEAAKHASRPAQSGFLNLGIATVIPDVLRDEDRSRAHPERSRSEPQPVEGQDLPSLHECPGSLLRLCAEQANCRHFGLLVGEKITLSAFGNLGSR